MPKENDGGMSFFSDSGSTQDVGSVVDNQQTGNPGQTTQDPSQGQPENSFDIKAFVKDPSKFADENGKITLPANMAKEYFSGYMKDQAFRKKTAAISEERRLMQERESKMQAEIKRLQGLVSSPKPEAGGGKSLRDLITRGNENSQPAFDPDKINEIVDTRVQEQVKPLQEKLSRKETEERETRSYAALEPLRKIQEPSLQKDLQEFDEIRSNYSSGRITIDQAKSLLSQNRIGKMQKYLFNHPNETLDRAFAIANSDGVVNRFGQNVSKMLERANQFKTKNSSLRNGNGGTSPITRGRR